MKYDPAFDNPTSEQRAMIAATYDVALRYERQTGQGPRVIYFSPEAWIIFKTTHDLYLCGIRILRRPSLPDMTAAAIIPKWACTIKPP